MQALILDSEDHLLTLISLQHFRMTCGLAVCVFSITSRPWKEASPNRDLQRRELSHMRDDFLLWPRRIMSCGHHEKVRIWNALTGQCLHLVREDWPVISLSFHPSGQVLAFASGPFVCLWDYQVGSDLHLGVDSRRGQRD